MHYGFSLYNIGVEEVKGENKGKPYRGLVYSALDSEGNRVGNPLKSSLFGKALGYDELEKHFDKSKERIKTDSVAKKTRTIVSASFENTLTESEFRAALREKGIDLVLRRNNEGRIYGATFIDHNQRVVLNGSRLGKEFSANVLNERFAERLPQADMQVQQTKLSDSPTSVPKIIIDKHLNILQLMMLWRIYSLFLLQNSRVRVISSRP